MSETFIGVDWGTSNVRARRVDCNCGKVLATATAEEGVGKIAAAVSAEDRPREYRRILLSLLVSLDALTGGAEDRAIVVSGMASSSIGWIEAPYADLPFSLDGSSCRWIAADPIEHRTRCMDVFLVSGVRGEFEVMRGEETEAIGLNRLLGPGEHSRRAIWVLPGTHSKHLAVQQLAIVDFQTAMTGELFDVLRKQSVLRHDAAEGTVDPASDSFADGLRAARELPLTTALFRVRTRGLFLGRDADRGASFLSGLLIGSEILGLSQSREGRPVVIAAGPKQAKAYETALRTLAGEAPLAILEPVDVERLSALGQLAILEQVAGKVKLS